MTKVGGEPDTALGTLRCSRGLGRGRGRLLGYLSLGSLLLNLLRFRHVIASLRRCLNSLQPAAVPSLRLVERLRRAYTNRRLCCTLILKEGKYQETLAFRSIAFSLTVLEKSV